MLIPRHLGSTITYHKTKLIAMFNCHILWNRCVDTFVYHVQFFFKIPTLETIFSWEQNEDVQGFSDKRRYYIKSELLQFM